MVHRIIRPAGKDFRGIQGLPQLFSKCCFIFSRDTFWCSGWPSAAPKSVVTAQPPLRNNILVQRVAFRCTKIRRNCSTAAPEHHFGAADGLPLHQNPSPLLNHRPGTPFWCSGWPSTAPKPVSRSIRLPAHPREHNFGAADGLPLHQHPSPGKCVGAAGGLPLL